MSGSVRIRSFSRSGRTVAWGWEDEKMKTEMWKSLCVTEMKRSESGKNQALLNCFRC